MKSGLLMAAMMSLAAADCDVTAAHMSFTATCSIPDVTTITSDCCGSINTLVHYAMKHPNGPPPQGDVVNSAQQNCASFAEYMQSHFANAGPPTPATLENLPAGLQCTESITGGGVTKCNLQAKEMNLDVSCQIPEETKISTECCTAIQNSIDAQGQESDEDKAQAEQDCMSFQQWVMSKAAGLGPPPIHAPPSIIEKYVEKVIGTLPSGLSCTQKIVGGEASQFVLDMIHEVAHMELGEQRSEVLSESAQFSLMPMIAVAGTAGALGGLLAFFAFKKFSSTSQRIPLIADDA